MLNHNSYGFLKETIEYIALLFQIHSNSSFLDFTDIHYLCIMFLQ